MSPVQEQVLSTLQRNRPAALFVSELAAKVRSPELESAIGDLAAARSVMVSSYPPPDPHLESLDLRIVALVSDSDEASAVEASTTVWSDWLRQFLANHRCQ